MTEQPGDYSPRSPDLLALKLECHRLVEQIAKQPGAIKLLLGLRDQARIYAGYKQTRIYARRGDSLRDGKAERPKNP